MKENLPSQAQWTVKLMQWLLKKELSLDELISDEDVIAGVVSYFTKKVPLDTNKQENNNAEKENISSINPSKNEVNTGKVKALEEELDFVKTRLAGADQQRKNEVKRLEERNAELREEIVKLTQKLKKSEKDIFESKFEVGKIKAAMKNSENEARQNRKKAEQLEIEIKNKNNEIERLKNEIERLKNEIESSKEQNKEHLENKNKEFEEQKTKWKQEKSKLLFILEERDNALSEAMEGQAAASREIQNMKDNLEEAESRLSILELEAVQKGVPMIRLGDKPIVGESVAKHLKEKMIEKQNVDEEDIDLSNEKWSKRKKHHTVELPASSINLGKTTEEGVDFSSDIRGTDLNSIEIEHKNESELDQDELYFNHKDVDIVGSPFNVPENMEISKEPVRKTKKESGKKKNETKTKTAKSNKTTASKTASKNKETKTVSKGKKVSNSQVSKASENKDTGDTSSKDKRNAKSKSNKTTETKTEKSTVKEASDKTTEKAGKIKKAVNTDKSETSKSSKSISKKKPSKKESKKTETNKKTIEKSKTTESVKKSKTDKVSKASENKDTGDTSSKDKRNAKGKSNKTTEKVGKTKKAGNTDKSETSKSSKSISKKTTSKKENEKA